MDNFSYIEDHFKTTNIETILFWWNTIISNQSANATYIRTKVRADRVKVKVGRGKVRVGGVHVRVRISVLASEMKMSQLPKKSEINMAQ